MSQKLAQAVEHLKVELEQEREAKNVLEERVSILDEERQCSTWCWPYKDRSSDRRDATAYGM